MMRLSDAPGDLVYPEFKNLPPNYMRCRVGVSGRYMNNQVMHLIHGTQLWYYLFATGRAKLDSNIVEIGCGCGRRAHHLRDLNMNGIRYTGQYLGIDINGELLDWCRANFDAARFSFYQSQFMKQFALDLGFSKADLLAEPGDVQHLLVAEK